MTRDETARQLREVLNEHAEGIETSPRALFSINRRVRDAKEPIRIRLRIPSLRAIKPVYAFSALSMLLLGLFAGILIARSPNNTTNVQVATPATDESDATNNIVTTNQKCISDASDTNDFVNVYFYCDNSLIARKRSTAKNTLESALRLLLAGPTQAELNLGIKSNLVDTEGDLIKKVTISDNWAIVNLSREVEKSSQTLQQLNRTVFDLENIQLVEYQVNGKCAEFSRTDSSNKCVNYTRQGVRVGSGDRRVVLFDSPYSQTSNAAQIINRTIYSCPDAFACKSLGTFESNRKYRYTGGQRTNQQGTWVELIEPTGKIGWVHGNGVSIQIEDRVNDDLSLILFELSRFKYDESLNLASYAFSPEGFYVSYVSSTTSGTFTPIFIDDLTTQKAKDTIKNIFENIVDIKVIDQRSLTPALENLKFVTVESNKNTINAYFDFRNGYGEIIAISILNKPLN